MVMNKFEHWLLFGGTFPGLDVPEVSAPEGFEI